MKAKDFDHGSTPFRISLQGPIKENPDQEIINYIVEQIKNQPEVISYSVGMTIQIPPFYIFFKSHKGRDFCVVTMKLFNDSILHIKELRCYEDIPWAYCEEQDVPQAMLLRLKR